MGEDDECDCREAEEGDGRDARDDQAMETGESDTPTVGWHWFKAHICNSWVMGEGGKGIPSSCFRLRDTPISFSFILESFLAQTSITIFSKVVCFIMLSNAF